MNPRARKLSIFILSAIGLISLIFLSQLPKLRFAHSISLFFPVNAEETRFYEQHQARFGSDNDLILISLAAQSSVFDEAFLTQVRNLEDTLNRIEGITDVYSPISVPRYSRRSMGGSLRKSSWYNGDATRDSSRIFDSGMGPADFFSADRRSVMMIVHHKQEDLGFDCATFSEQVEGLLKELDVREIHTAGKCLNETLYITTLERESILFTSLAVVFISLILWLLFRNVPGILIPLIIIGLTVLWTVGIMIMMGETLNLISHILPVILLVISMSDVIHLRAHYLSQQAGPDHRLEAYWHSVRTIGKATVFTSVTTMVGFLTLTTSSFQPVVELGMYASIGLALALVLTYLVSGSIITLFPSKEASLPDSWRKLDRWLHHLFQFLQQQPRLILGVAALLLVLGIAGSTRLEVNQYILDELPPNHPHQQDFGFFAEQYQGIRAFDIDVRPRNSQDTLFTVRQLREIAQVTGYLRRDWAAAIELSPSDILTTAHQIYLFGRKSGRRLPADQQRLDELMIGVMEGNGTVLDQRWITEDRQVARISGRIPDVGSQQYESMHAHLEQYIADSLQNRQLDYHITGTAYLMDMNTASLVKNMLYGLGIALLFIAIMFAAQLQSWRMVFISLAVNVLPLVVLGGVMGFLGMNLKISTSFVFVIAFGIAVDDSIHFLSRLRQELRLHDMEEAVRRAFFHSGKAIFLTTIILLGGFLTFCWSDFLGTFTFGVLLSTMLLLALLADLVLLPVLIRQLFSGADSRSG